MRHVTCMKMSSLYFLNQNVGVFDACWTFRQFCIGKQSPVAILQERETIYKILDQMDPSRLNKKFADYTLDPRTRYLNFQQAINSVDTPILFVEEDKSGKRRSLAPTPRVPAKKSRGNTIKDQEALIFSWLKGMKSEIFNQILRFLYLYFSIIKI